MMWPVTGLFEHLLQCFLFEETRKPGSPVLVAALLEPCYCEFLKALMLIEALVAALSKIEEQDVSPHSMHT